MRVLKGREQIVSAALLCAAGAAAFVGISRAAWSVFGGSAGGSEKILMRAEEILEKPLAADARNGGTSGGGDKLGKVQLFVPVPERQNPGSTLVAIMGDEALMGEQWVKAGDTVAEAKIISVLPSAVVLEWRGKREVVPLFESFGRSDVNDQGDEAVVRKQVRERRTDANEGRRQRGRDNGMRRGRFGGMSEEQRAAFRERMRQRWESMSEEERQQFRERIAQWRQQGRDRNGESEGENGAENGTQ